MNYLGVIELIGTALVTPLALNFYDAYSYLSNKRLFFLRIYSRPYAVIPDPKFIFFWKRLLKIWVKIEKSGYFQQFLCLILQKFQALR